MIPLEPVRSPPLTKSKGVSAEELTASPVILLFTGVCMKQQKKLVEAIVTAQNHGKRSFQRNSGLF